MPKTDLVPLSVSRVRSMVEVQARLAALSQYRIYIGIPPGSKTGRRRQIREVAGKVQVRGPKTKARKKFLIKMANETDLSNADLLYLFERGSPRFNRPPRSVLRASLADRENKTKLSVILQSAALSGLAGQHTLMRQRLEKAGKLAAQNAKDWFYSERNNWPGNAPRTIREKGFDQPGIETETMRNAITSYIERIQEGKPRAEGTSQPKTSGSLQSLPEDTTEATQRPVLTEVAYDPIKKTSETLKNVVEGGQELKMKLNATLKEMEMEALRRNEEAAREAEGIVEKVEGAADIVGDVAGELGLFL